MNDLRLNHIDKLSLIKKLGGISKDKYSLSAEMARRHKMLDDLLCTIHRDGGHYINDNGYKKSTEDAISKVMEMINK